MSLRTQLIDLKVAETLPMPKRTQALEYIRNAPEEVVTPVRKEVNAALASLVLKAQELSRGC
jgi:hypothetical protein